MKNFTVKKAVYTVIGMVVAFAVVGCIWWKVSPIFEPIETNDNQNVDISEDETAATVIDIDETEYRQKIEGTEITNFRSLSDLMNESAYYFTPYVLTGTKTEENRLYSPASLYIDMMALRFGTSGNSTNDVDRYLGLNGLSSNKLEDISKEMTKLLNRKGSPINVANALFADKNRLTLNSKYVSDMKNILDMEVMELDFTDVEKANEEINKYVNEKTKGMIPEGSGVSADTVIDLMNVIYYNDSWDYFSEEDTSDREFTLENGDKIQVPTMYSSKINAGSLKTDDQFSRLDTRLKNSTVQIILPEGNETVESILSDGDKLKKAMTAGKSIESGSLKVFLPKFTFDNSLDLKESLEKIGCEKMFNSEIDLSNMVSKSTNPLQIGHIKQKAKVELNEKGVTAAAVTEIGIRAMSAQIPSDEYIFDVNKPFIFTILDSDTNLPLFIGVVKNPVK